MLVRPPKEKPWNWRKAVADTVNGTTTGTGLPPGATSLYDTLIHGDPGYISGIGAVDAAEASAQRARANAIKAALIQFGAVPAGFQSEDIAPADVIAAGQNPYSTLAQLLDARQRGSADLAAVLAGRGVLRSGALTGGEQALTRQNDLRTYDETNKLLAALGGYQSDYATRYDTLEGQRQGIISDAADRVAQQYPYIFAGGTLPPTPGTRLASPPGVVTPQQLVGRQWATPPFETNLVKPPSIPTYRKAPLFGG